MSAPDDGRPADIVALLNAAGIRTEGDLPSLMDSYPVPSWRGALVSAAITGRRFGVRFHFDCKDRGTRLMSLFMTLGLTQDQAKSFLANVVPDRSFSENVVSIIPKP